MTALRRRAHQIILGGLVAQPLASFGPIGVEQGLLATVELGPPGGAAFLVHPRVHPQLVTHRGDVGGAFLVPVHRFAIRSQQSPSAWSAGSA